MKCPEPGCGKRGLKGHQGVEMHIARVHTKTIVSPGGPRGPRRSRVINAIDGEHSNGHADTDVLVEEPPVSRRRTGGVALLPPVGKFELNGCPNCLFPLRIMNDALAAEGIPIPPFCPNCTMPVEIIRTSMTVALKHKSKQPV
jgi:hypothetical protein